MDVNISDKKVFVTAPARLHMGFFDLSGSLGRKFGSIGVALEDLNTHLSVSSNNQMSVSGPSHQRAERCALELCQQLNVSDQLKIDIKSAIPEHVGLGSGTQMSLAIGSALNEFYELGLSVRDIARIADRGMRSGIGIGVFERGGLVVDGGRTDQSGIPPVISNMAVPSDWRFILVFDDRGKGLHGSDEIEAFRELAPFPAEHAAKICYLLLMQGLPAIAENDIKKFGEVISLLQNAMGEHFASAQGGVFTSPEVEQVMLWLEQQGAVAIGQTSWGPTGFCAVQGEENANQLIKTMSHHFSDLEHLSFISTRVRNSCGGVITVI